MRKLGLVFVALLVVGVALVGVAAFTFADTAQAAANPTGAGAALPAAIVDTTAALAIPVFQEDDETAEDGDAQTLRDFIDRDALHEAAAAALGMTVAELEAAQADGLRLPDIAEQQGVELETVQAAVQAAFAEMVDDAVAAGVITVEQGERILQQGLRGPRRFPGRGFSFGDGPLAGIIDPDAIKEATAGALGLAVDELEAARADGLTLAEIAQEQGVALETVEAAVLAVREEMVDEAVAAGIITAEQGERILEHGLRGGCHSGPGSFGSRSFGNGGPRSFGNGGPRSSGNGGPRLFGNGNGGPPVTAPGADA